jgi:hypothetical protein
MNTSLIQFQGDEMFVPFERFDDPAVYATFLAVKRLPEYRLDVLDRDAMTYAVRAPARFASMLGVERPSAWVSDLPLSDFLFDDQAAITRMALEAKRFACWSDCGLGKTVIGAEYARHVIHRTAGMPGGGGRVLIVTLNEVVDQWVEEIGKFYGAALPVVRLNSREEMKRWCATGEMPNAECRMPNGDAPAPDGRPEGTGVDGFIDNRPRLAVVNYEKFNHKTADDQVVRELRHLAGIILDESSRLKTGGGKQKWALIKSSKGIEYKLSLTATPAPNEYMEFASQASWLEKLRDENEIIWTFFQRNEKTHRWSIRPHARKAFFEFMAGWSIYVRDPRRYGWRMNVEVPPKPETFVHTLPCSDEQRQLVQTTNVDESGTGSLFADRELNAIQTNRLSQAAKGFIYEKESRDGGRHEGSDPVAGQRRLPDVRGDQETAHDDVLPGVPEAADGPAAQPVPTDRPGVRGGDRRGDGAPQGDDVPPAARAARGFRRIDSAKPPFVADLIAREVKAGLQVLVWTVFDAESRILEELLRGHPKLKASAKRSVEVLVGSTSEADRVRILNDFRHGKSRVLISRASMLGYGMNFQHVGSMVFSGWTFSYEQYYQAVRRAYRHGQQKVLRVHIPVIPELEGQMYEAIGRKQQQHETAIEEMERNYVEARRALIGGRA